MSMRRQLLTHCVTLVIDDLEKAYERLLVYACVGGMPGHLRSFDRQTAGENVLDANLPLRDEATAEPVLRALAGGARTERGDGCHRSDGTQRQNLSGASMCARYRHPPHVRDGTARAATVALRNQPPPATQLLPVRRPTPGTDHPRQAGRGWQRIYPRLEDYACTTVRYAVFVCGGPDAPACRAFQRTNARVINLEQVERDLQGADAAAFSRATDSKRGTRCGSPTHRTDLRRSHTRILRQRGSLHPNTTSDSNRNGHDVP